jgi:hypothetical protein
MSINSPEQPSSQTFIIQSIFTSVGRSISVRKPRVSPSSRTLDIEVRTNALELWAASCQEGVPMPNTILIEELHLTVVAPVGLGKAVYQAMLRTLRGKRFQARLYDAIREVFRHYPSLKKIQFSLDC